MNNKAAGDTKPKLKLQAPLIDAALYYRKIGFSVIPIKLDKKPYCSWAKFQTSPASPAQLRKWWGRWPTANIGLVTGSVSGVDVVDVNTQAGWTALNEFLPDALRTPIAKTPGGGWHVYFSHREGLTNGVRVIEGCDLRTTGGYITMSRDNILRIVKAKNWATSENPNKLQIAFKIYQGWDLYADADWYREN